MKSIRKIKKVMKISLLVFVILFLVLFFVSSCMQFRASDKKLRKELAKRNFDIAIKYDSFYSFKYRYLHYKNKDTLSPTLVFIHGAPGSATAFTDYLYDSLLQKLYSIIVVDRIGYGYSSYGNYLPLAKQGIWLKKLLQKEKLESVFLIGHSFGGSIAARTAVISDSIIKGTILIAPALDPKNEKYVPGGKLAYWAASKWMFSKAWQISAFEKYHHAEDLRKIENDWKKLKTPLLQIHGTKDNLVPYINLRFAQSHFDSSIFSTYTMPNEGHLIPFTKKAQLISIIIKFTKKEALLIQ